MRRKYEFQFIKHPYCWEGEGLRRSYREISDANLAIVIKKALEDFPDMELVGIRLQSWPERCCIVIKSSSKPQFKLMCLSLVEKLEHYIEDVSF